MTPKGTNYYQPLPLDFLVLEAIPDKGILGGVHFAGRPAKHVVEDINAALPDGTPPVATSQVMARLRSMNVAGHVDNFASVGSGRIWARTESGRALLARKEAVLGG